MKNKFFPANFSLFSILIVFLFLVSCKNDLLQEGTELVQLQDDHTEIIYKQVLEVPSFETTKLKFTALSPTEKSNFWGLHVDRLIEKGAYTDAQTQYLQKTKKFLQDLHLRLQAGNDTSNNPDPSPVPDACTDAGNYFDNTPETLFAKEEFTQLFVLSSMRKSLFDSTLTDGDGDGGEEPTCNCYNVFDCAGAKKCKSLSCVKTFAGCGPGALCDCRGLCGPAVPVPAETD